MVKEEQQDESFFMAEAQPLNNISTSVEQQTEILFCVKREQYHESSCTTEPPEPELYVPPAPPAVPLVPPLRSFPPSSAPSAQTHDPIVTLLVRNLPDWIPHDTVSSFFSFYGATSVRPCSHGREKNCAYVDFKNEAVASKAHKKLHGVRLLGKVLSAEKASELVPVPQEPSPCNTTVNQVTEKQSDLIETDAIPFETTPSVHEQGVQDDTNSKRKRNDIYVDKYPANTTHSAMSQGLDIEQTDSDQNRPALHDPPKKPRSSEPDVNLANILKAINDKYGDITRDCALESDYMKTAVSLGLYEVVQALQNTRFKDVDISFLDACYAAVRDAEFVKVNVHWLRKRLEEVKYAMRPMDEAKDERNKSMVAILENKEELNQLASQIRDVEDQLAREIVMVDELNTNIGAQELEFSRLEQFTSLMDEII